VKDALKRVGNVRAPAVYEDSRSQGTWMGARRTKRGRAAASAAGEGRVRGWAGAKATTGGGLVSHRQQAMKNARST